jgi:hypothetical protein
MTNKIRDAVGVMIIIVIWAVILLLLIGGVL